MGSNPYAITVPKTSGITSPFPSIPVSTPEMFGAAGDGTTDDTLPLKAFFAQISGKFGILSGQYKATSLVGPYDMSNCVILGLDGSLIFGAFGYAVIKLGALSNVLFDGVSVTSTNVNTTEDTSAGVVYSFQDSVSETQFIRCKFSAPNTFTNGLSFYPRINSGDTSATINGLWITDCVFSSVGRMGCIILNRGTASDKYEAAKRIYFLRNHGLNTGAKATGGAPNGFLISLDGFGSDFEVDHNTVEGCWGIGIENTGWINGSQSFNRFKTSTHIFNPMTVNGVNGAITNVVVEGNICEDTTGSGGNAFSYAVNCQNCKFIGNAWGGFEGATWGAMLLDSVSNCKFIGDTYQSNANYAIYPQLDTSNNDFIGCTFDNSVSAANFATIRFNGSADVAGGTTGNRLLNCRIAQGTGGVVADQRSGAFGNLIIDYATSASAAMAQDTTIAFPSDANYNVVSPWDVIYFPIIALSGVLTATRNLNFKSGAVFQRPFTMVNGTSQSVVLQVNGSSGDTITSGAKSGVYFDGTTLRLF